MAYELVNDSPIADTGTSNRFSGSEQQNTIGAVCERFDQACRQGCPDPLEVYVACVPEAQRVELLSALISIRAWWLRKSDGKSTDGFQQQAPNPAGEFPNCERLDSEDFPGFELLGPLGRGGMGIVLKAKNKSLGRFVALKIVATPKSGIGVDDVNRRFQLEAEAVAALKHPNIVDIYSIGKVNGQTYLELEYVDGPCLNDLLQGKCWPARDASQLICTLGKAVQYAHSRGIIHRDLKPSNVLIVSADFTPKLVDFGLAKILSCKSSLTQAGVVLGTPCYMPPEQATGELGHAMPTADVYGLGAILYELLTGVPPHRADTADATLELVRTQTPLAPRSINPSIPAKLDQICLKCLVRDSRLRYASVHSLVMDLEEFLQSDQDYTTQSSLSPNQPRSRRIFLGVSAASLACAFSYPTLATREMRIALWPYVGYAPLVVAAKMGLCPNIQLVPVMVRDIVEARPLVSKGRVHASACVVDSHVHTVSQGVPAKALLKLASSAGADALVARPEIHSLDELRGKRIAYIQSEPPHFLLLCLFDSMRLKADELQMERREDIALATQEFIDGKVDAVVTFSPYLADAVKPGVGHILASSKDFPNQIVDILCVHEEYLSTHCSNVSDLIAGWFRALDLLEQEHPQAIEVANDFLKPSTYGYDKAGVKFASRDENRQFFQVDAYDHSEFRKLFLSAQERWGRYERAPDRLVSAKQADAHAIGESVLLQ